MIFYLKPKWIIAIANESKGEQRKDLIVRMETAQLIILQMVQWAQDGPK